jgi:hypothetical protein
MKVHKFVIKGQQAKIRKFQMSFVWSDKPFPVKYCLLPEQIHQTMVDKKNAGIADSDRNVNEDYQLRGWSDKFARSCKEPMATDVEAYLKK